MRCQRRNIIILVILNSNCSVLICVKCSHLWGRIYSSKPQICSMFRTSFWILSSARIKDGPVFLSFSLSLTPHPHLNPRCWSPGSLKQVFGVWYGSSSIYLVVVIELIIFTGSMGPHLHCKQVKATKRQQLVWQSQELYDWFSLADLAFLAKCMINFMKLQIQNDCLIFFMKLLVGKSLEFGIGANRLIRLFSKCYVVDLTGNTTLIYKIPRENLFSLALSKRPSAQKVFNKTKELLSSLRGLKFSFQVMAHNQLGLVLKS